MPIALSFPALNGGACRAPGSAPIIHDHLLAGCELLSVPVAFVCEVDEPDTGCAWKNSSRRALKSDWRGIITSAGAGASLAG